MNQFFKTHITLENQTDYTTWKNCYKKYVAAQTMKKKKRSNNRIYRNGPYGKLKKDRREQKP